MNSIQTRTPAASTGTPLRYWGGELGDDSRLELQLTTGRGGVRGTAHLVRGGNVTTFVAHGDMSRHSVSVELRPVRGGDSHQFKARREGETLAGTLSDGRASNRVVLRRHTQEQAAPPPPPVNAAPEDLPVKVTYEATVDGKSFHFGDFSLPITLIPTGSWSGPSVWGTNSGLVTVTWLPLKGGNVSGQLLFTLSTWNPFSPVGYLYINRWDVDDKVAVKIEPGSSMYWSDRWVNVSSGSITMYRNG